MVKIKDDLLSLMKMYFSVMFIFQIINLKCSIGAGKNLIISSFWKTTY